MENEGRNTPEVGHKNGRWSSLKERVNRFGTKVSSIGKRNSIPVENNAFPEPTSEDREEGLRDLNFFFLYRITEFREKIDAARQRDIIGFGEKITRFNQGPKEKEVRSIVGKYIARGLELQEALIQRRGEEKAVISFLTKQIANTFNPWNEPHEFIPNLSVAQEAINILGKIDNKKAEDFQKKLKEKLKNKK